MPEMVFIRCYRNSRYFEVFRILGIVSMARGFEDFKIAQDIGSPLDGLASLASM